jgi:hypothetical protein
MCYSTHEDYLEVNALNLNDKFAEGHCVNYLKNVLYRYVYKGVILRACAPSHGLISDPL